MNDLPNIPKAAALSQTAGVVEPARYFASGPQGHFFADDLQLARDLVNLYDKDDDWTITDLRNPTGAAPAASGGEYPGCSGDPASCPENEGHGCCKPTPKCSCPSGDGSLDWPCKAHPPAAASVSERARAIEMLAQEVEKDMTACADDIRAGKLHGMADASVRAIIRAMGEQALTQQRGAEPVPAIVREVLEWYASDPRIWLGWNKEGWAEEEAAKASGHYTFIGEDERGHNEYGPNHVRAEEALAAYDEWLGRESTTPQPIADAVRVEREVAEYQIRHPLAKDDSWRRISESEYEATISTGHSCGEASWTREWDVRKLYASAIGEAVDLEQFRPAVRCWKYLAGRDDTERNQQIVMEATRLLKLIDASKVVGAATQSKADAVRELAKNVLNWQPLTSINKADRLYQILVAAGLPFESVTDELESLLGRGGK